MNFDEEGRKLIKLTLYTRILSRCPLGILELYNIQILIILICTKTFWALRQLILLPDTHKTAASEKFFL